MKIVPWALMVTALSLSACNDGSDSDQQEVIVTETAIVVDLPSGESLQRSLYVNDTDKSAEQYIRNYLLNKYATVTEYTHDYVDSISVDSPLEETAADSDSSDLSETNTIEQGIDEADIIKAFNYESQDYLLTLTEAQYSYLYTPEIKDSVSEVSLNQVSPASINLYEINETPSAQKITSLALSENAQYTSGFYQFDSNLIVQSRAIQEVDAWQDPIYWNASQKVLIDSIALSDKTLAADWSLSFDGRLIDSRRLDSDMYLLMRKTALPIGLEYPWEDQEKIAANIALIEQFDVDDSLPTIQKNGTTTPAFELDQCYLPDDTERYLTGGIVFNYLAKIDLNDGSVTSVKCVLADINQVYMNTQSLFLIDSQRWNGQTSRLHRFSLEDFSYDNSLVVEGTLGWDTAEFRIKELDDGTVVLITSQNESSNGWWDLWWNNSNTVNKLRLFQKASTEAGDEYQQIAEYPNEEAQEEDDSPLSLGKAGEQIYGVRIDESTVKVVTFQQTDPLYIFDITNRHDPKPLGELQEDGVSVYLHNFAELTLGVGYDANEWGSRQGLKVELYDHESGVASIEQYIFGGYAYTPVDTNYHAFTSMNIVDTPALYKVAIPAKIYNEYFQYDYTGLLLFTIDTTQKSLTHNGTITVDNANVWNDRSVIQGEAVHYFHDGKIYSSLWNAPGTVVISD